MGLSIELQRQTMQKLNLKVFAHFSTIPLPPSRSWFTCFLPYLTAALTVKLTNPASDELLHANIWEEGLGARTMMLSLQVRTNSARKPGSDWRATVLEAEKGDGRVVSVCPTSNNIVTIEYPA